MGTDKKRYNTLSHMGAISKHDVHSPLDYTSLGNYCKQHRNHPPTHTHITDRLQWGGVGDTGVDGGVESRCRNVILDLSDISGRKRGSSGQPPPLTPSLRGGVSIFSKNQRGPKYVRGSSNKIYRWGQKQNKKKKTKHNL